MDYQMEANCPLIHVAAKIKLALMRNETQMSCNIAIFNSLAAEKSELHMTYIWYMWCHPQLQETLHFY